MRLPARDGERIRRDETRTFSFDGTPVDAFAGDTIGSALFAGGRRVFSRSFKYHRPRGLTCASGGCASCLMEVDGEPGVRVCTRPVRGGEVVRSQSLAGSIDRDPMRLIDRAGPLTPVGFYYRLGIRPKAAWPHIERLLRRLTGVGRAAEAGPGEDRSDVEHRQVDVLVVGAGRAGREAAARHVAAGREVVVVDERVEHADLRIEGAEVLAPAAALGIYEGRLVPVHAGGLLHRIRARHIVVATGTIEQPLLFDGNDLPGVMTPGAVRRLIELWSLRPGTRAVVLAAEDGALHAAGLLRDAGVEVAEVVDLRDGPRTVRAHARRGLLASVSVDGRRIACDLLVASAGRQPAYSLLAQAGCAVRYDEARGVFVPDELVDGIELAGSVAGGDASVLAPDRAGPPGSRAFVCPCEDVTVKDLGRAVREGFDGIEIAKRYSTVTMGPCQGRLCHLHSVRVLAAATGQGEAALGTTTARPPWTPTPLGALGGRPHVPGKRTALHDRHLRHGATYVWTGIWRRPDHYGDAAAEIRAVHEGAGLMDVSTLGKLLVTGPEALAFLDGVFPNRIATLQPGRVRYAVLNTDTGRIVDDGTVVRLAEDALLVTTSSGGVDQVYEAFLLWIAERGLDVEVANVSGALGAVALSGPRARDVLARVTDVDVSNERLEYLGARQGTVAGAPALVMRIGFLGELGFEIHFPSTAAEHVWDAMMAAGAEFGIQPLGVEALKALRLEKGHIIIGIDTDSESTMLETSLDRMIAWDKGPFVGRDALVRMRDRGADRRLVGFVASDLPREGTAVLVGDAIGGRVTSARHSAVSGRVIGLAYVPAAVAHDDARFEMDMGEGRRATATVHLAPFHDPDGERMRA